MFPAFTEMSRVELTLYTDALITRGWVRTRPAPGHRHPQPRRAAVPHPGGRDGRGDRATAASRSAPSIAQVNLDSVLFAVADVPVESSPELRTPKTAAEAIVSVPPFRITGTIHLLPGELSLREALSELTGAFLPVTDATYWSDRLGEARRSALLVAVNHRRTQILAQHQEVDPWAGLGAPAPSTPPAE